MKTTKYTTLSLTIIFDVAMLSINIYLFAPITFAISLVFSVLLSLCFYWIWYESYCEFIKYTYQIDSEKIEIIGPKGVKTIYWATDLEDIVWQTFAVQNDLAGASIITKDKYKHKVYSELNDYDEFIELLWNYTKKYLKDTRNVPVEIKVRQIH